MTVDSEIVEEQHGTNRPYTQTFSSIGIIMFLESFHTSVLASGKPGIPEPKTPSQNTPVARATPTQVTGEGAWAIKIRVIGLEGCFQVIIGGTHLPVIMVGKQHSQRERVR